MRKLLFFLLLSTTSMLFGFDRVYQKEFPVSRTAQFSLESYKGKIVVRTDTVPTIRVRASIVPDEGTDPALVDHVQIMETVGDNRVSIEVKYDSDSARMNGLIGEMLSWPLVNWDITLPDDASLSLETYKSEVDLDVPSGRLVVDSYKGFGNIRGVRNRFKLETYKGAFDVEVAGLADIDAETYKGDISLEIHGATDFTVEAETRKGNLLFTGIDLPIQKENDRMSVYQKIGGGDRWIKLETYKGNIKVDFR